MLDSKGGPWQQIYESGAEKTWVRHLGEGDYYLRYSGTKVSSLLKHPGMQRLGNNQLNSLIWPLIEFHKFNQRKRIECEIVENILKVRITERWSSITTKTMVALEFALQNFDFDYVIRGNASVHFNIGKIKEFLVKENPQYAGPSEKNKVFATGWAIILSKDVTLKLVNGFSWRYLRYFDDEAFGKFLQQGAHLTPMPFLKLNSINEIRSINRDTLIKFPAIRAKIYQDKKRIDDQALRLIQKIIDE